MDYFRQGWRYLPRPGLLPPLGEDRGEGLAEFHYWLREQVRTFLEG